MACSILLPRCLSLFVLAGFSTFAPAREDWQPAEAPLLTRWGKKVKPENAHREYPRPQLVRDTWQSLNGLWDYGVAPLAANSFAAWEGKILVPFSIEAPLSGVGREVTPDEAIWYQRTFEVPPAWQGKRILLHFEASDFQTTVWLNGQMLGGHRGGYNPFSFDLSDSLVDSPEQVLVVRVHDPQEVTSIRSLGKQANRSGQYTRCSGIWGSVWLEPVDPRGSVEGLKLTSSLESLRVEAEVAGERAGLKLRYQMRDRGRLVDSKVVDVGETAILEPDTPRLWSPDDPFLYDLVVELFDASGELLDTLSSYAGLRTVGIWESSQGTQLLLNGKPLFQLGPLDQNYWPGGGLTPPSVEAMQWEADYLKRIGCNMVRLHIKVNPRHFYHICDRTGLLVWQDFVSPQKRPRRLPTRAESDLWVGEQRAMIDHLHNHPSIVMWVVFNEAWGQHDTERIAAWAEQYDPSRLLTVASGWTDLPGAGDVRDIHDYSFCPALPVLGSESRAVVLGEFGGLASALPKNNWNGIDNRTGPVENPLFGGFEPGVVRDDNTRHDVFRPSFSPGKGFARQYGRQIDHLRLLKNQGLTAAVYTQMSDMKLEQNGWVTFDREKSKAPVRALRRIHKRLFEDPPVQTVLLPSSFDQAQDWEIAEYPFPAKAEVRGPDLSHHFQHSPDFDRLEWKPGRAPFGNLEAWGSRSFWDGERVLVARRTFDLEEVPEAVSIRVHTVLEAEGQAWNYTRIHINGTFVADDTTRQWIAERRIAERIIAPEEMEAFREGENTLVVEFIPLRRGQREVNLDGIAVDVEITAVEGL